MEASTVNRETKAVLRFGSRMDGYKYAYRPSVLDHEWMTTNTPIGAHRLLTVCTNMILLQLQILFSNTPSPLASDSILHLHCKMKILAAEFLIVLGLLVVPYSLQLVQRQALHLFQKARRSRLLSANYGRWLTSDSFSATHSSATHSQNGSQDADRISPGLPGQPPDVGFAQYSGYVTVDSSTGRALFYYFAEPTTTPSTKPLVLWLNGGPGCSSFGVGALQELGPFRVNPDGKTLYRNPYAWNQVANTLFLESPAGVGFSYSNTTSDYEKSGDKRTAEDSYAFLVNWFERFPQYKYRDFYIIGESYAGNYIPELTVTILNHNNGSNASFINLKGIMIGNGIMNSVTDDVGRWDYRWTHALISDQSHEGIQRYCIRAPDSKQCENFIDNAFNETGDIDPENIYAPLCLQTSSNQETSNYAEQLKGQNAGYDPCSAYYVDTYLNTLDVQRALHANVTDLPYPWTECSSVIDTWNDSLSSMFPLYRRIIEAGLQILIYSGDVDSVVPVTSTRYSIGALKLPIETSWYPWLNGNEVGGYSVIYKGLTFATVRGAGHEVPSFQPVRALTVLKYFLAGKPLPKDSGTY